MSRKLLSLGLMGLLGLASCGRNDERAYQPMFQVNQRLDTTKKVVRLEPKGFDARGSLFLIDGNGDGKIDETIGTSNRDYSHLFELIGYADPDTVYMVAEGLRPEERYIITSDRVRPVTMSSQERDSLSRTVEILYGLRQR